MMFHESLSNGILTLIRVFVITMNKTHLVESSKTQILTSDGHKGSCGGTSGRAMAFYRARPGSNPRSDLPFFQFRIAANLFSLDVGLF